MPEMKQTTRIVRVSTNISKGVRKVTSVYLHVFADASIITVVERHTGVVKAY
jgi:hypothetical protein